MRADDLVFGARSGIQKGIRRGDLDLTYTCFTALWGSKEHRNWLKWRLAILVLEECWYLAGELAIFLKKKDKTEEDYKKFIYQLVLAPKAKDAGALYFVAKEELEKSTHLSDHPEVSLMKYYLQKVDEESLEKATKLLFEKRFPASSTKYEVAGAEAYRDRIFMGGMFVDRLACLAGMILIASRRMKRPAIKSILDEQGQMVKEFGRKPKTVNLDWYCFDMHTYVGKMALSIFMARYGSKYHIERYQLSRVWFFLESARVPRKSLAIDKLIPKPGMLSNMWWPIIMLRRVHFHGRTPKETKEFWVSKVRPKIESIVNECLETREGESGMKVLC